MNTPLFYVLYFFAFFCGVFLGFLLISIIIAILSFSIMRDIKKITRMRKIISNFKSVL